MFQQIQSPPQDGAEILLNENFALIEIAPATLTDAASIATDASVSTNSIVTLGGNRTLANPTNLTAGQVLRWEIKQDATGSRTLAYGTLFKWPGGTVGVLSTAANAIDLLTGYYDGTRILASLQKGFA